MQRAGGRTDRQLGIAAARRRGGSGRKERQNGGLEKPAANLTWILVGQILKQTEDGGEARWGVEETC